ncbi:phage tail tube protein [Enterococcus olivae]
MYNITLHQDKLKMDLQTFALASKGATLSYKQDQTTVEVAKIRTIPQIGSDPERLDVTHLKSERREYIKGIQDTENLEFEAIYESDEYAKILALEEAGDPLDWVIAYPDGLKVEFKGEISTRLNGIEVNAALIYTIVLVPNTAPEVTPAP